MHVVAAFAFLGTREYRLVGSGTTNWKLSTMSSLVTGPRSRLFRGVLLSICTVVDTAMCALATLERILCFKRDDFCVFTGLSICGHKWNAANTSVSTRILPAKWAKLSTHYRLGVVWLPQLVFRMACVDRLRAVQLSCQTGYSGPVRT